MGAAVSVLLALIARIDFLSIRSRSQIDTSQTVCQRNLEKVNFDVNYSNLFTIDSSLYPYYISGDCHVEGNCYCTESAKGQKMCEDLEQWLYKNRTAFAMSGKDWIHINDFVQKAGFDFLFDVNVLVRNRKDNWRYKTSSFIKLEIDSVHIMIT